MRDLRQRVEEELHHWTVMGDMKASKTCRMMLEYIDQQEEFRLAVFNMRQAQNISACSPKSIKFREMVDELLKGDGGKEE